MPTITYYIFTCPAGHIGYIDEEQAEGEVSIICDQCDFHGFVDEGKLGEKKIAPYAFGNLLG